MHPPKPDPTNITSINTNIYVVIDTLWSYRSVVDYVNFIMQRLNINPYASSVTLLAASDGAVMVNTTNYLSEFFAKWNITTHSRFRAGFHLPRILNAIGDHVLYHMETERNISSLSGQSLIALLIPSPVAYIAEEDFSYTRRYMAYYNYTLPDLKFLYYAGGAVIRFKDFVDDPNTDLFALNLDRPVAEGGEKVVKRIREIPRAISNPRCAANWYAMSQGQNKIHQYLRLGGINFYSIASNYFYPAVNMRYLKIQAISPVSFSVCTSRSIILPFFQPSSSPPEQQCSQFSTNVFVYDLSEACWDYDIIMECPPLYFSVQAQTFADSNQVNCNDAACPAPDAAEFAIIVNNLSCNDVGTNTMGQLGMIMILLVILVIA